MPSSLSRRGAVPAPGEPRRPSGHGLRSVASTMSIPRRDAGPLTIALLLAAMAVLWIVARPPEESTRSYLGQLLGAESVLLLSIGLVLISTLPWVEEWFDGIDRAAIWHRRVAIAGLVVLLPHVLLSSNPNGTGLGKPLGVIGAIGLVGLAVWAVLPRWQSVLPSSVRGVIREWQQKHPFRAGLRILGGYERWRLLHRTTGLFVAAAFLHGVLDGTPFHHAPLLRWSYVAVGAVGVAFYLYRELFARFFVSLHDYEVAAVREVGPGLTEITLRPLGRKIDFVPGQFAMVYVEAKDGWHRHPFTIASAPHEDHLRVTVKALGDYTSRLPELLEHGMPAVVGGPHGRFDHTKGTQRQVWIAGGVGVAPFLSWLRALDGSLPYRVEFFYSADGEPPFAGEIRAIADRHDALRVHLLDTSRDGRLTPGRVLEATGGDVRDLSVFMCGPQPMLRSFQAQLVTAGVPAGQIHREYFDWR
jgi:predicted ferric reductase